MEKISGTPEQLIHRRELVDALRSGKYKQAIGKLRNEEGFCCLGVGADISGKGEWDDDCRYNIPGEPALISNLGVVPGRMVLVDHFGLGDVGQFAGVGKIDETAGGVSYKAALNGEPRIALALT